MSSATIKGRDDDGRAVVYGNIKKHYKIQNIERITVFLFVQGIYLLRLYVLRVCKQL